MRGLDSWSRGYLKLWFSEEDIRVMNEGYNESDYWQLKFDTSNLDEEDRNNAVNMCVSRVTEIIRKPQVNSYQKKKSSER